MSDLQPQLGRNRAWPLPNISTTEGRRTKQYITMGGLGERERGDGERKEGAGEAGRERAGREEGK